MKFTCERCGKKYATAEDPAPGRVYKLKCKACGHLIVVRAAAPASAAGSASGGAALAPAVAEPAPLDIATPEPARIPGDGAPAHAFDATFEVASPATAEDGTAQEGAPQDGAGGPPGEAGYVDLFADVVSGSAEIPQRAGDDPFLAAARASLPETYGSGTPDAPDPFASLRDDLSAGVEPPPREPPPVPKVPVIPRPKQEKSVLPLVLIGAGVAVMIGILAFVLFSSGKKGPPHAPAPAVAVPAPPPPAPPAPVPEPAQVQPPAAAAPAPEKAPAEDAERRARAEQRRKEREEAAAREDQARAEARARQRAEREAKDREAREAADRERAEREARARSEREAKAQRDREAREAREQAATEAKERERLARQQAAADKAAAEPEGGLTQAQIEGVLRSTKPAFDGCMQGARGTDVKLDGRRVMLRLNIQTSGTVTYPTLDDVTLNGTELGSCLKSAARLMVFPKFKGDTMHVEIPLVMR